MELAPVLPLRPAGPHRLTFGGRRDAAPEGHAGLDRAMFPETFPYPAPDKSAIPVLAAGRARWGMVRGLPQGGDLHGGAVIS